MTPNCTKCGESRLHDNHQDHTLDPIHNMQTRTPGDWRFDGPAPKDSPRYNPISALMGAIKDERGGTIASMIKNPADGALLAAAPVMAEALRGALEGMDGGTDDAMCHIGVTTRAECAQCKRVDAAHAALAAAERE